MKSFTFHIIIFVLSFNMISCVNYEKPLKLKKSGLQIPIANDTLVYYRHDCCFAIAIDIKYPKTEAIGTILMLQAYNIPHNIWCELTDFCKLAIERNFVIITPNFGNSLYLEATYPETSINQSKYPCIDVITEMIIPDIQNQFGLLVENQNNFIAGLSSGGRGAILIPAMAPDIFIASASISGFIDINFQKEKTMFIDALGEYSIFPERWDKEIEINKISNYNTHLYIAHGLADTVSNPKQSMIFFETLSNMKPNLIVNDNFPVNETHGFSFWRKETENILNFFESFIEN